MTAVPPFTAPPATDDRPSAESGVTARRRSRLNARAAITATLFIVIIGLEI
jgi:hypothetical protein